MANEQGGTYLWVLWSEIALSQMYMAGRSRLGLEVAEAIGPKYLRDLDGELSASMISISASAHAIDGFYGSVASYVDFPPGLKGKWRQNRTKRPAQILETLKLAFSIGHHAARWTRDLRWLFDLRDSAVHHKSQPGELIWDAQERTKVPQEHGLYNLENANRASKLAVEIMEVCVAHPRPGQQSVIEWMPDARHFVEVIKRMRIERPRYAF